jgi:MerR family transcriptional regulator, light-induced transcriptional regulator
MNLPAQADDEPARGYRIGAVSRMTGIPVPTIRMWERRYQMVVPNRSQVGARLYAQSEVDRLSLLKTAVDAGHAIGTVVYLSDEDIRARLERSGLRRAPSGERCRVAVIGRALGNRLSREWAQRTMLEMVGIHAQGELPPSGEHIDALVIDCATLHATQVRNVLDIAARFRPRLTIVVYGFASRATLRRLDRDGVTAVRAPVDAAHLARVCLMSLNLVPPEVAEGVERLLVREVPVRRFDDDALGVVSDLKSSIKCECPHHLADLLVGLNAFEKYSLECESSDAADAATHAMLYSAAAQCRHLLENALEHVLEREGLDHPMLARADARS